MDLDKKVSESGYGKSTKEDTDGSITGAAGMPKDSVVEVTINGSDITARWIQGLLSYDSNTKTLTFSEKNLNSCFYLYQWQRGTGICKHHSLIKKV